MPCLARSVSLDSRVQTPHILPGSCASLQLQHASRYRNLGWLMGLEPTTLGATSRCSDQRSTRHRRATNACCFWLRWRDRPRDVRSCRVLHDPFSSTLGCKRHTSCPAIAHPCNCSTHRLQKPEVADGLEPTTLAATSRCADQRSTRHRRATNACCFWLRWRDRPRDVRLCRVLHDLFPSTLGCKRHISCPAVAHPCNCSTHRVTET